MQNMPDILPAGTVIQGRYVVQAVLGNGGFGAVYLVMDQNQYAGHNISNLLILKEVINPNKHELYQMVLESTSLRLLFHQALPRVYNVISYNKPDRAYILMDYVEGWNLSILLQEQLEKAFSFLKAMTIMEPIMDAVAYMHSRQPPIIHQNIKPVNIIVRRNHRRPGKVVLVNFGIGKKYNLDLARTALRLPLSGYEAPEQCTGEANARTDIYGLGATLYSLLTNIVPPHALYRKKQVESQGIDPLKPVDRVVPTISSLVADAIYRAMSLNSNDRFSTVAQFERALQSDAPWQKTPQPVIEPKVAVDQHPSVSIVAPPSPADQRLSASDAVSSDTVVEQVLVADIIPSTPLDELPVTGIIPSTPADEDIPMPAITTPDSIPEQVKARSTTTPVQGKSLIERARKPHVLLPVAAVLLLSIIVGAIFLSYAIYHNSRPATSALTQSHQSASQSSPPSTVLPTPTPSPTIYPNVARTYDGTIYNVSTGVSTKMSLAMIQQNQGNISGYFTGLQISSPFTGNINTSRHVHFTLVDSVGHAILAFDGAMQSDGNLAGTYCNLNQQGRCSGAYGIWSVGPVTV